MTVLGKLDHNRCGMLVNLDNGRSGVDLVGNGVLKR
jgi:hypothetical protein